MVTLSILILILAAIMMAVCGVGMVLLDPIIATLVIVLVYKLVRKFIFKK